MGISQVSTYVTFRTVLIAKAVHVTKHSLAGHGWIQEGRNELTLLQQSSEVPRLRDTC